MVAGRPGGRIACRRHMTRQLFPQFYPIRLRRSSLILYIALLLRAVLACGSAWAQVSPIYFGADYYAEDYSSERVEADAAAMQRAGFNLVRMLDTNWAAIEPRDGVFDFVWLDRTLDVLEKHGIRAILGVPSYVPPYWMLKAHPEFLLIGRNGEQYRPGGMGGVNLLNLQYREYVRRLDDALARHYGADHRVLGWQIDNEIGIWGGPCYNPECVRAFQDRLRQRFGSIDNLNRRWGTVSYGHRFTSFDEVPLNAQPVYEGHQSSLEYEARRFFSDLQVQSIAEQAEVFRRLAPGQFVVHNATGPNHTCNYFDLAKVVDQLGYDNYPQMGDHASPAFNFDLARGYNKGRSFFILEQLAGAQGPYTYTTAEPPPGQLRLWAYQALAHGADGVLFFRWRTARSGSEEFWQGLLDPVGADTRRLREIAGMGAEIHKISPLLMGTHPRARMGLVYSWNAWTAQEVGGTESHYIDNLRDWHSSMAAIGNVDVVSPDADLSNYAAVVAPDLYLVDDAAVENFKRFVTAGGTLILGPRTGVKDADNRFFLDAPQPGPLLPLTGSAIDETTLLTAERRSSEDYTPEPENTIHSAASGWAGTFASTQWAEILTPKSASTVFEYGLDYYKGRPAVTANRVGKGTVIYLGTVGDAAFRKMLLDKVINDAGIQRNSSSTRALEIEERTGEGHRLLFVMNFSAHAAVTKVNGRWTDALSGAHAGPEIRVEGLDVRILYQAAH